MFGVATPSKHRFSAIPSSDQKLVNWWVRLSYLLWITEITGPGSIFTQQPKETQVRVCLKALEAEKMAPKNAVGFKVFIDLT